MVGAILSTFNSVLNSSATLFSEGIYRAAINRAPTGPEIVRSGRLCSIVLAVATMSIAPFIDASGSLYNYLQRINSIFLGPLLAVILLGFLTRRVSALAAKIGLLVGPVVFYLLVFAFGKETQAILLRVFSVVDEIHFLHLLGLVFVLTTILLIAISRFSPVNKVYEAVATNQVDMTPWRFRREAATTICILTLGFYILLAQ